MSGASREPGWYPDQHDPDYNRYWNGRAWTARRHPVGAPPPPDATPRSADPPPRTEPQAPVERRARMPIWLWVIAALLLVRTVFSVVGAFDHGASGHTTAVPSHPAVVAPSPGTTH